MFNKKEVYSRWLTQCIEEFSLSDNKTFRYLAPSRLPWVIYSPKSKPEEYLRERVELSTQSHCIDFIRKDHEFSHFIWRTSSENAHKAMLGGLISFDSLTSQVLCKLGTYKNITTHRAYYYGIVSNKHHEKLFLLDVTQKRILALQIIERLINSLSLAKSDIENKSDIICALNEYIKALDDIIDDIKTSNVDINEYDKVARSSLINAIQVNQGEVLALIARLEQECPEKLHSKLTMLTKVRGKSSFGALLNEHMVRSIRQAQWLNQNITYSRHAKSINRGDLNSVCEDALHVINKYKPDLHNPTLPCHQGIFDQGTYALDFSFLDNDHELIEKTLMEIAQIEDYDSICQQSNGYTLNNLSGEQVPLLTTRFTKWRINESTSFRILRMFVWSVNIFTGLAVGFTYDLFAGLIAFISGQKLKSGAQKLHITLPCRTTDKTKYEELKNKINANTYSLGTLVGIKIRNFLINVFWDMTHGAKVTFNQMTIQFIDTLKADYQLGHSKKQSPDQVINIVLKEIEQLATAQRNTLQEIKQNTAELDLAYESNITALSTEPPYHLSPGEWMDISNSLVTGIRYVFEVFTDNIHAKHPTSGMIFTLFYTTGIGAILFPKLFSFLPKGYIAFSESLGKSMSKGTMTKAISSGMTQAQIFSAAHEGFINGNSSWIAKGSALFEKSPADIVTYITIAVGLGYLIAFEFEIPYLSEAIREDLGTIPIPSLGFAGAKICILLADFLKEKSADPIQNKPPSIRKALEPLIDELLQNQTLSETSKNTKKQEIIDKLLSITNLGIEEQAQDKYTSGIKKLLLLQQLESSHHLLPHLLTTTKQSLLNTLKVWFPNDSDIYQTIKELLYPPPPQSIFVVTLTTVTGYIPLLARAFLTPVTKTLLPFKELRTKLRKDLARVANTLSNAFFGASLFIRVICRGFFDIAGNEIAARVEGCVTDTQHCISSSTYKITEKLDVDFECGRQILSKPLSELKASCTHSGTYSIFNRQAKSFCHQHQSTIASKFSA